MIECKQKKYRISVSFKRVSKELAYNFGLFLSHKHMK